jgi:hypothetical protein
MDISTVFFTSVKHGSVVYRHNRRDGEYAHLCASALGTSMNYRSEPRVQVKLVGWHLAFMKAIIPLRVAIFFKNYNLELRIFQSFLFRIQMKI